MHLIRLSLWKHTRLVWSILDCNCTWRWFYMESSFSHLWWYGKWKRPVTGQTARRSSTKFLWCHCTCWRFCIWYGLCKFRSVNKKKRKKKHLCMYCFFCSRTMLELGTSSWDKLKQSQLIYHIWLAQATMNRLSKFNSVFASPIQFYF